jgi:hypothetical protein
MSGARSQLKNASATDGSNLCDTEVGLLEALVADGRPLLSFTGVALILSGLFAIFQSITGHFLPHDEAYLGMTSQKLCEVNECRIVHFMFHDRVSFGGSLIAIGTLYMWLTAFPLKQKEPWAWWLFVASGVFGFGSFLAYLGYGYLDSWHGIATLALLPVFGWGLIKTYSILGQPRLFRSLLRPSEPLSWTSLYGFGRLCLLTTAFCLFVGGLVILRVGVTSVFVPQDLTFMSISVNELHAINPRLVPLIAHDRAGFGGGVGCCGLIMFFCLWCGRASRSLWQTVLIVGAVGFGTAIGVHPAIGYIDFVHLAPACLGAALFAVGIVLTFRRMYWSTSP